MPENCCGNEYMEGEWGIMVLTARMKMNRSIDVRNDKSFVTDYTRIAA